MSSLLILLILFVALFALALASLHWGADSRDGLCSEEWKRKVNYPRHHL